MRRRIPWLVALTLLILMPIPSPGQEGQGDEGSEPPPTVAPPPPPPAATAPSGPMVTEVRVERTHGKDLPEGSPVQLEDHLVLVVSNYQQALDSNTDCFDLRLFLDGKEVTAPGPEQCDERTGEVWFNIARINRGKEEAWQDLIAKRDGLHASAAVSLGLKGQSRPLETKIQGADALRFMLLERRHVILTGIFFLLTVILFLWLSRKSAILRDPAPELPSTERPFSLARAQMAWWFFLVLWAFIFITMISGNIAPIPGSILGLMGIAAGTFLGAEVIDTGKQQEKKAQATEAKGGAEIPPPPTTRHQPGLYGFFYDILSDGSGVAFHRFQIVVFTIAIGGIFIVRVSQQLVMPEFDTTLLGLMGISSGTYIGAKFPEATK